MAPSNEHRIIAKLIDEGEYRPLLDRSVTPAWFTTGKHRDAFEFIHNHYEKYSEVPSKVAFQGHIGTSYPLFAVGDTMDYLLDSQAEFLRWQTAKRMLPDVEDALRANRTSDAIGHIEKSLSRINTFTPTPSRLVDSMDGGRLMERWTDYERREKGGAMLGFTTGFPTIDKTTLGLQPGHLVTVLAQPKVGKTSLCLSIASHVYVEYEKPILFVSFEMGITEMEMRQEALMSGINFADLQAGNLSKLEKKKYAEFLDKADSTFDWPFHFMDAAAGATVSAIRAQIDRMEPALCVLDGVYMMTDEATGEQNTAQALTNITRNLKRTAAQTGIPILINTQALNWKSKGQKITMDSAGYSSSFAQDSDVILGLERIQPAKGEDEEMFATSRMLRILASRNTGNASVELVFDYECGKIEEVEL